MKRLLINILILFAFTTIIIAQNSYIVPNSPRSPEAASFMRYMELPVSLYTGTVDVSIPLYSLQVDDITIPLTLSYHNAGVKVEEEASWVGLGWNLSAGGVIFRRVNGIPDDYKTGGWQEDNKVLPYPTGYTCVNYSSEYYYPKILECLNYSNCKCNGTTPDNTVNADNLPFLQNSNLYDFEPDIYSYSFGGNSGTFSFDKDGNLVKREQNNLKISYKVINSSSTFPDEIYWEIIDENGNIYEFKKEQWSFNQRTDASNDNYASAWFITKITTNKGNTISFTYNTDETPYIVNISLYSNMYDCLNEGYDGASTYTGKYTETVNTCSRVYLTNITTSQGNKIDFTIGNRTDLENGSKLNEFVVTNSNNQIVKKYKFGYSYFVSSTDAAHEMSLAGSQYLQLITDKSIATANIRNSNRLKLDWVKEVSSTGIENNPYNFTYNSINLPVKTSYSVDHWGYYNGAANINKLPSYLNYITNLKTETENSIINEFRRFWQADRQQNTDNGKACMLTQFTYPTMGTCSLIYEPNTFTNIDKFEPYTADAQGNPVARTIGYGGGFRVKSIINTDPVTGKTITKTFNYYNGLLICIPYYAQYIDVEGTKTVACPNADGKTFYWGTKVFSFNRILITSYSNASSSNSLSGSHVGYNKVEEVITDGTATTKTEYNYHNEEEIHCGISTEYGPTVPFVPNLSNGTLESKVEYNGVNAVKSTTYNYNYNISTNNYGLKPFVRQKSYGECGATAGDAQRAELVFYKFISQWNELSSVTETVDRVTTTTTFNYGNKHHLPTKVSKLTSVSNDTFIIKYKYPLDFLRNNDASSISIMQDSNMVNYPIEIQELRNNKISNSTFNLYSNYSNVPLLNKVYKTEFTSPLLNTSFKGLDVYGNLAAGSHYRLKQTIGYDNNLNISEVQKNADIKTIYLWGYNNNLPIAEVKNASVSGIFHTSFEESTDLWASDASKPYISLSTSIYHNGRSSLLFSKNGSAWNCGSLSNLDKTRAYIFSGWVKINGNVTSRTVVPKIEVSHTGSSTIDYYTKTITNTTSGWQYFEVKANLPSDFKQFTFYLGNGDCTGYYDVYYDDIRVYPADAQMTTYTHDPLVGVTSITDANNQTTYYIYDTFGRLSDIKDKDGKVLKHYEYNYSH